MCKFNPKNNGIRIDPCMRKLIAFMQKGCDTVACCCGHGKYPMTIVINDWEDKNIEVVSGIEIPRKKKFYKKDKQGFYYIPEVVNERSR